MSAVPDIAKGHRRPTRLSVAPGPPRRDTGQGAFTLIESLGVLAVLALLVAAIAPSIVRRIDRAAWMKETADLQAIADSYVQYILRNKTIPTYTNWAAAVASEMSLPPSAITNNLRRNARVFLIDPALSINSTNLPYKQTTNGTTRPVSARLMVLSSLTRALPANIVSGVPTSTEFNAIWDTAEGAKPSTWTNWAGSGDDLRIKKLNLEPLFHQLILVDRDVVNVALFSIDGTNVMSVLGGGLGWNKYYLDGTILGLYGPTANLQSRQPLKRSLSFVFESGTWPDQTPGGPAYTGQGADFVNHALGFFGAALNPYAGKSGTQIGVIMSMYTFMFDYALWANECAHFSWHGQSGSNPQGVPEYDLLDKNSGNLDAFTKALIAVP